MELTQNPSYTETTSLLKSRTWFDWLFLAVLAAGALFALNRYGDFMDIYEKGILLAAVPTFVWLGWYWRPVRLLMLSIGALSLWTIAQYGGNLEMAQSRFLLKYLFSSQSAILWMSMLFFLSTIFHWGGLLARTDFGSAVGSKLCWAAILMGFTGMMVRWYESYLLGADIGHIPVSNLYEVFVLFCLITALFTVFYEEKYATRQVSAFILLIISAAVGFLLWYMSSRDAQEIQPLVPALQSWWMKIHVPANFIGYGTFALAAMVGVAYLVKSKGVFVDRLPSLEVLDDIMYKAIFHHRHYSGCLVGSRCMGWLLVMGSQRNLGVDCLAKLRRVVTYAFDEGSARANCSMVGGDWFAGDYLCFPRCEYVPLRFAFLRRTVKT